MVLLCLQYIEGVNRLRGVGVCKWLIWMVKINVGCGQEDTVGVLSPKRGELRVCEFGLRWKSRS